MKIELMNAGAHMNIIRLKTYGWFFFVSFGNSFRELFGLNVIWKLYSRTRVPVPLPVPVPVSVPVPLPVPLLVPLPVPLPVPLLYKEITNQTIFRFLLVKGILAAPQWIFNRIWNLNGF